MTDHFLLQAVLLRGVTCSEVRAEELTLELDPNVHVKEEARRLSEQSNLSDQTQAYQPYPCRADDMVSENTCYSRLLLLSPGLETGFRLICTMPRVPLKLWTTSQISDPEDF